jgi:hypothetical protein
VAKVEAPFPRQLGEEPTCQHRRAVGVSQFHGFHVAELAFVQANRRGDDRLFFLVHTEDYRQFFRRRRHQRQVGGYGRREAAGGVDAVHRPQKIAVRAAAARQQKRLSGETPHHVLYRVDGARGAPSLVAAAHFNDAARRRRRAGVDYKHIRIDGDDRRRGQVRQEHRTGGDRFQWFERRGFLRRQHAFARRELPQQFLKP